MKCSLHCFLILVKLITEFTASALHGVIITLCLSFALCVSWKRTRPSRSFCQSIRIAARLQPGQTTPCSKQPILMVDGPRPKLRRNLPQMITSTLIQTSQKKRTRKKNMMEMTVGNGSPFIEYVSYSCVFI